MLHKLAFIDATHVMTGALIGLMLAMWRSRPVLFTAIFAGLFYLAIVVLGLKTGRIIWSNSPDPVTTMYRFLQVSFGYFLACIIPELWVVIVVVGLSVSLAILCQSF
jgi:hypothetical protein